jgi:hypothetical protein
MDEMRLSTQELADLMKDTRDASTLPKELVDQARAAEVPPFDAKTRTGLEKFLTGLSKI